MAFCLSKLSRDPLQRVHLDLVRVVGRAIHQRDASLAKIEIFRSFDGHTDLLFHRRAVAKASQLRGSSPAQVGAWRVCDKGVELLFRLTRNGPFEDGCRGEQ
jgi:hypothetical protein